MAVDAYANFDAFPDQLCLLNKALRSFGGGIVSTGRQGAGTYINLDQAMRLGVRVAAMPARYSGVVGRDEYSPYQDKVGRPPEAADRGAQLEFGPRRVVLGGAAMTVDYVVIQRETPIPERPHRRTEGPVRTCVGCRKRELAVDLLRVVAMSNGNGERAVTVDQAGNLPGRGAWLHPTDRCLEAAIRRRAFGRALRITGSPDTSEVVEEIRAQQALTGSASPVREQAAKNMSTP
ncbi:YlxR family protein [Mycolicibacterium sarraceniae]|uniref:YlxR domain-containing protein n=1 Tax=Mycolicibacterium sarraceniae TaxID=1534348 RepID=A0A7I7STG3_9MYCO|nr:YlxR family protein [Mycolicibacterium sarraceniae]BBY60108.1 hypothetical protein MSAR_32440 [Mycolicibacterium sarraceniae]